MSVFKILKNMSVENFIYECLVPIRGYQYISTYVPNNVMDMINANDFGEAIRLLGGSISKKDNLIDIITNNIFCKIFR